MDVSQADLASKNDPGQHKLDPTTDFRQAICILEEPMHVAEANREQATRSAAYYCGHSIWDPCSRRMQVSQIWPPCSGGEEPQGGETVCKTYEDCRASSAAEEEQVSSEALSSCCSSNFGLGLTLVLALRTDCLHCWRKRHCQQRTLSKWSSMCHTLTKRNGAFSI